MCEFRVRVYFKSTGAIQQETQQQKRRENTGSTKEMDFKNFSLGNGKREEKQERLQDMVSTLLSDR
jgi:queuine/archaeosine tRNA-ribosyltransferase